MHYRVLLWARDIGDVQVGETAAHGIDLVYVLDHTSRLAHADVVLALDTVEHCLFDLADGLLGHVALLGDQLGLERAFFIYAFRVDMLVSKESMLGVVVKRLMLRHIMIEPSVRHILPRVIHHLEVDQCPRPPVDLRLEIKLGRLREVLDLLLLLPFELHVVAILDQALLGLI